MRTLLRLGLIALMPLTLGAQAASPSPAPAPWDSIARLLQSPAVAAAGTFRYNFPRRDLRVRIGDVTLEPAIALVSWAGFGAVDGDTMVMGDLVATETELPAVLRRLGTDGLSVVAVHNHLVGESPHVMYIHYEGHGGAIGLAERVGRAIAVTGAPRPVAAPAAKPVTVDTALVYRELGARGRANGAVVQLGFQLVGVPVVVGGKPLPPPIAYGSPINIQMVSDKRVVATGDFAVPSDRLVGLVNALTTHGIVATAVHSHLVGESPTLSYIHFWADGPLPDVLRGLKAALDAAH